MQPFLIKLPASDAQRIRTESVSVGPSCTHGAVVLAGLRLLTKLPKRERQEMIEKSMEDICKENNK